MTWPNLGAATTATRAVAMTAQASNAFFAFMCDCIDRHARGDWGDVCTEDRECNERSIEDGSRILSAYTMPAEIRAATNRDDDAIWIITEAEDDDGERSGTIVLFPEEY
jgi:hypothetical protein